MKRRDFLKLSLLTAMASFLTSCEEDATETTLTSTSSVPLATMDTSQPVDVLVIGAGMAGLATARLLTDSGYHVLVLEGRDRIGGRIHTSRQFAGMSLDLGASWIHGVKGNPITALAEEFGIDTVETDYDSHIIYNTDGSAFKGDDYEEVEEGFTEIMGAARELAEELDDDTSLQAVIEEVVADLDLTAQQKRRLNYALNSVIEHEYAGNTEALSAWYYDEGDEFGGEDVVFPHGYDQIIRNLAQGLAIQLEQVVLRIARSDAGIIVTTNQNTFVAERVVVTVPLGILKKGNITFDPPLSTDKQRAIQRLGMGLLNKVYLKFPELFWDKEEELLGYVAERKGEWAEFLNMYAYLEEPVLLAFNAGTYGTALENLKDTEIIASVMQVLRTIYGNNIPEPNDWIITRWRSDPFAFGSYSYMAVGATPDDRETLAESVGDYLFFAGEATSVDYPATVHGAYLSGQRVAEDIMNLDDE